MAEFRDVRITKQEGELINLALDLVLDAYECQDEWVFREKSQWKSEEGRKVVEALRNTVFPMV